MKKTTHVMYVPLCDRIDYNIESPAFSQRRLDEGPVLNRIGRLCMLLHRLGLKTPAAEIFSGKAKPPTFHKRMKKELW